MTTLTQNKNPLSTNDAFKVVFQKAPNTSYFCQNFIMPSVTVSEVTVGRPQQDAYFPGDKLVYEPLTLTMLVAEDLNNFSEIYDWLARNVKTVAAPKDVFDDITVHILNSKKNVNRRVVFKNAFPTNIGSISFSVSDSDIVYPQVDVTFRYDYFTIE